MSDFKHLLGSEAKSKVTGFKGIIIARSECLYGCNRYLIQPKIDQEGKQPEPYYHDEEDIEITGKGISEDCAKNKPAENPEKVPPGPPASKQATGASRKA